MDQLPLCDELMPLCNDLLAAIFAYNNPIDHCRIRRVCREWRQVPLEGYVDEDYRIDEHGMRRKTLYKSGEVALYKYLYGTALETRIGGKLHGDYYFWNIHMKLVKKEHYENGFYKGLQQMLFSSGRRTETYVDDSGIITTEFDKNGQVDCINCSKQLLPHGVQIEFARDKVKRVEYYRMGELVFHYNN